MYKLVADNIIMAAGGPMGSPVKQVFIKFFNGRPNAIKCAEEHCNEKLSWTKRKEYCWHSNDYGGAFQYTIELIRTED